jgi:predicted nucleotidyltransferase
MGNLATPPVVPRKPAARKAVPARISVADALFGATQQRLLALLFGQPQRSFFTKELIDLAGGGSGAIQRELDRLHRSGLVVQTTRGNQKHYRANDASPIYAELCGIASKMLGPADTLRQALAALADDIELALLYGSVAARRDTAHSDIDVLIVSGDLTLEQAFAALAPAEARLGRKVNPTLYTSGEFRKRLAKANPFLTKVLAGETIALIGDKDAVAAAG